VEPLTRASFVHDDGLVIEAGQTLWCHPSKLPDRCVDRGCSRRLDHCCRSSSPQAPLRRRQLRCADEHGQIVASTSNRRLRFIAPPPFASDRDRQFLASRFGRTRATACRAKRSAAAGVERLTKCRQSRPSGRTSSGGNERARLSRENALRAELRRPASSTRSGSPTAPEYDRGERRSRRDPMSGDRAMKRGNPQTLRLGVRRFRFLRLCASCVRERTPSLHRSGQVRFDSAHAGSRASGRPPCS